MPLGNCPFVPASDTSDPGPGPSASFTSDDGQIELVVKSGLAVTGATFQFVLPAAAVAVPSSGAPGTLTVNPGIPMARVASCAGPTSCAAALDTDYSAKVTLLP